MRKGLLTAVPALFAVAGLALAQSTPTPSIAQVPPVVSDQPAPVLPGTPEPSCCATDPCGSRCGQDVCGPPGRLWGSADYLLWWLDNGNLPPLVTVGPPGSRAVLGAPGTAVPVTDTIDNGAPYQGGRFSVGGWLDDCQTLGVEGGYFFLGTRSRNLLIGSTGTPTLSIPFRNVTSGLADSFEDVGTVAVAGASQGAVNVSSSTRLQGAELNGLYNLLCGCGYRVDVQGGFRYLSLHEGLGLLENSTVLPTVPIVGGNRLIVSDRFETRSQFYGGQLGLRGEVRRGDAFAGFRTVLGLGNTCQTVDINGGTLITRPITAPQTLMGGSLALPTNIGRYTRDTFSLVPEVGINVGYQLTANLRAYVGYTFLYWTHVVRPGDQIDRAVNTTQSPLNLLGPGALVGPARPAFTFHDTDFWAQGINLGVEVRY